MYFRLFFITPNRDNDAEMVIVNQKNTQVLSAPAYTKRKKAFLQFIKTEGRPSLLNTIHVIHADKLNNSFANALI